MNGPQHYAEAERLLELAESTDWTTEQAPYRDPALAAAQVHATLAQVAAIANHQSGESSTSLAEPPSAWDNDASGDGPTWESVIL